MEYATLYLIDEFQKCSGWEWKNSNHFRFPDYCTTMVFSFKTEEYDQAPDVFIGSRKTPG